MELYGELKKIFERYQAYKNEINDESQVKKSVTVHGLFNKPSDLC